MSVLADSSGRGDILLDRGITNAPGALWEINQQDGNGFQPVDLTDWDCVFEMFLPGSETPVFSQTCDVHGADGIAGVNISATAFTGSEWFGRRTGTWRITGKKDDVVELLGSGYWHLV